jgi:hypothetical protein
MGATNFLTKERPKAATEMALNVLAYNIKRVIMIVGLGGLLEDAGVRPASERPNSRLHEAPDCQ